MPEAVLFDLDGVLVDSRIAIVRCIEHALRVHGAPVPPSAELERFIGPPLIDGFAIVRCIEHALRVHGAPVPPSAELERFIGPPLIDGFAELAGAEHAASCLEAYRERYVVSSLEETTVVPGAREAVAAVAAAVPVAVATSKPHAFAVPLCERLGLTPHLRAIVGPELDAPEEIKAVTVGRALLALGLAIGADAPLVGDRRHDAEAAAANGLRCVGVLWGIGDEAELRAAGADPIVAAPAELISALGVR